MAAGREKTGFKNRPGAFERMEKAAFQKAMLGIQFRHRRSSSEGRQFTVKQ